MSTTTGEPIEIYAECRISMNNTIRFLGHEYQLPTEPFINWLGQDVVTIWKLAGDGRLTGDYFEVLNPNDPDCYYYEIARVPVIIEAAHIRVALPSGGTATVAPNAQPATWTTDLHDHPKRFISIGLWGTYREETPHGDRVWRAPWIRSFPATHIHRLSLIDGRRCWTLVLVLKTVRGVGLLACRRLATLERLPAQSARRRYEELRGIGANSNDLSPTKR